MNPVKEPVAGTRGKARGAHQLRLENMQRARSRIMAACSVSVIAAASSASACATSSVTLAPVALIALTPIAGKPAIWLVNSVSCERVGARRHTQLPRPGIDRQPVAVEPM